MNNYLYTFSAKDWLFFFDEQLRKFSFLPPLWDATRGNGFGENMSFILGLRAYQYFTTWSLHNVLGFSWLGIEIVLFWASFVILGVASAVVFARTVFGRSTLGVILAAIIFLSNTYIVMLLGGGQLGVILAYATSPLVFASFIRLMHNVFSKIVVSKREMVIASIPLGLQLLFDIRITIITMVGVFLYFIFYVISLPSLRKSIKTVGKSTVNIFFIPSCIAILLHAFWIVPFLFAPSNPLQTYPDLFTNSELVRFFSFADFSHVFSLLHPNWPENIFGKTYFMQPEFLVLPIIAYSSLLFISKINPSTSLRARSQKFYSSSERERVEKFSIDSSRQARTIIYFSLLGLVGAFLAKGTNPPFGNIYVWLFNYVPGFTVFRDPTKFYLFIALSYAVLLPYGLNQIGSLVSEKLRRNVTTFIIFLFLSFWAVSLRPLFLGDVRGTFRIYEVPNEYILLKNILLGDKSFSRTLWIPQRQRFGFYSIMHPAVSADKFFQESSVDRIIAILSGKDKRVLDSRAYLRKHGIGYIIVPYDSQEEFFLKDRKYSHDARITIDSQLSKIPWLTKRVDLEKISVYEIEGAYDLFWLQENNVNKEEKIVQWQMIDASQFKVDAEDVSAKSMLVFSQRFDPNWVASYNGKNIVARKLGEYQNGFEISEKGTHEIVVNYKQQRYMDIGLLISGITLVGTIVIVGRKAKE